MKIFPVYHLRLSVKALNIMIKERTCRKGLKRNIDLETYNPYVDFRAIYKPLLLNVVFYLISVAMCLVSFFLSKFAFLEKTEIREESRLLPGPQIPSRYISLQWQSS